MTIDDGTPEAELDEPIKLRPLAEDLLRFTGVASRAMNAATLRHFSETLTLKVADGKANFAQTQLRSHEVTTEQRAQMEFALDLHWLGLQMIAETASTTARWLDRKVKP